jgi:hypothetical protein
VVAVNAAETLIAIGFSSGVISLIESRTGSLVATWKGGDSEVTNVGIGMQLKLYFTQFIDP